MDFTEQLGRVLSEADSPVEYMYGQGPQGVHPGSEHRYDPAQDPAVKKEKYNQAARNLAITTGTLKKLLEKVKEAEKILSDFEEDERHGRYYKADSILDALTDALRATKAFQKKVGTQE